MAEVKTQQIVEQSQENICPLCSTTLKTSVCQECAAAIFPIIASNLQKKTNKKSPFQDVDNLVFQGGGVKGVAYLGVMKAFEKDYPNLLPNVKRIAGTSAGSMLALYLGLNKTPEQIEELLSGSDYSVLLDNGQEILVKQSSWVFFTKDYKFNAKEVILKAMGYLKNLEEMTKDEKVLRKQLVDIFTQVFTYLLSKIGFGTRVTMELFGSWFIHFLANWLLGVIFPASDKREETVLDKHKFINQCQDATAIAIENVQRRQKELEEIGELPKEPVSDSPRDIPKSHPSELDNNEILLCAVAELIWQLFRGKKEGDPQEIPIGLFTAEKVKQDLMITPIYDSLKAINKHTEYKAEEITFAELASLKNQKGDLAFRPFYVCAFNTATFRTDVFSVDHSPNVVVADAIRASMSIPLFFQSVPISEKIGGVLQERRAYNCAHEGGVKILYMDGGIMDNYPIWIFDDLKYCLDDKAIPNWQRDQRVGMQNPNTLGCKLLDIDRIDIYEKPYKDQMREKAKLVQDAANIGSYFAVIKFLIKIEFNEHEESAHAQRGDYFRTIYVYDCKISAVDFALNPKQKDMLISSGSLGVDFFRERANKSFEGEIGTLLPKNAERK